MSNRTTDGRNGDDTITGTAGDDTIYGGAGNDRIDGDAGDDLIFGGAGDDTLIGGDGADVVKGGEGDDKLIGDGQDALFGGDGRDTFDVQRGDNVDGGAGGDDFDVLDLRGLGPLRLADVVRDEDGNGWSGRVEFLDRDGIPTGETLQFTNIEDFLKDDFAANRGPDAVDDSASTTVGNAVTIDVLGNDSDPDGDPLTVTSATATNGSVVINPDGTLTFTPEDGFAGGAEISYTVSDGNGGSDSAGVAVAVELAAPGRDGIIQGTTGADLIDAGYTGDPDGDMVDNNDAILPGASGDEDLIYGYSGDDEIRAGAGSDEVFGGSGNDTIDSSDGETGRFDNPYPGLETDPDMFDDRDTVYGGLGDDTIRTGDDRDTIFGGDGADIINAGIDDDLVHGDAGDDTIIGSEGNDRIFGGDGDDLIYGGLDPSFPDGLNIRDDEGDAVTDNGQDVVFGGSGNDTVFGEDDADTIFGDAGDDTLFGGIDDDTVFGGTGNDMISGGQGDDQLFGGDDRDLFTGGNGGDRVDGGGGGDDFDTLDLTGADIDYIEYTSDDREDGIVHFTDGSTMRFEEIERVVPCFTPGTLIATPRGERLVEELREGDRIITRDNGIQEIRWVGRKEISARSLLAQPHLRPVLIRAGALGHGLPERDMMVSPNHRLLIANDRTQLYFDESEVLAAAKHLVGGAGILEAAVAQTAYIHFMFDRHQVVLSNGAWTESFQPGDHSLQGIGAAQRDEILGLFPELQQRDGLEAYGAARKSLKKYEARLLAG